tara:strand:- start:637 stop:1068 length:432 start_codon:yes stop_codon:yes gene_type:complete
MSFVNPIDYTGFSSPFRADLVANNRNVAEAKKKAGNYLRAGRMGGLGASQYGQAVGQGFLDDAGAYAAAQQRGANAFSGVANAVGSIGGFAAAGGFGKPATQFSQPVFGQPKARETIGGYGGNEFFKPSDIPGFDYSPIPLQR